MSVVFHDHETGFKLRKKSSLKQWILAAIKSEGFSAGDIQIITCHDEYLLKINQDFLQHDYYTDIITFDYSQENTVSGELYISIDRIIENAGHHKVESEEELHRVIIHGILHLCGYKDKTDSEKSVMTEKEDHYLRHSELNTYK